MKTGFRRWKRAHGKDGGIHKHRNSQCHVLSMIAWTDYEKSKSTGASVQQVLSEALRKRITSNRHYLRTMGEILLLTTTQGIAQRGHRERVTTVFVET